MDADHSAGSVAETRQCTACGTEKPLGEFNLRSRVTGRRTTICRPCENEKSRRNYAANKQAHLKRTKQWQAERREQARQLIWQHLLSHPCVDCGESDPRVLEFDHVTGKDFLIAGSWSDTYPLAVIAAEIAKCEMRCANCHRKKTAADYDWWRDRWLRRNEGV